MLENPKSSSPLVVHLAPGHVAFDTRVFHKEARTLADAGYRVVVVAAHDKDEEVDGIRVVGIPRWRSRADRFLLRPIRLGRLAWRLQADVYQIHDIEALPIAVGLALLGRTVIIDSHEDYPRLVLSRRWIPRPLRGALAGVVRLAERFAAARVRAVISAEEEGARRFPSAKTVVVRNYVLPSEFPAAGPPLIERNAVAAYVGDLTMERGAVEMVEAIGLVDSHLGPRLTLAGRFGTPGLQEHLEALPGWRHTSYRGFLDREGVGAALNEARVGLILLHPTAKFTQGAIPVKIFEYMAAGIPVLASDFPLLRSIVEDTGGGIVVDPRDVKSVAVALERLLGDPVRSAELGARGRAAVLERYSWTTEAATLLELYERLSPVTPAPSPSLS